MIQNEDKLEIFIKKYQKHIFFYLILFLSIFIAINIYKLNKVIEEENIAKIQSEIIYQNNISNIMEIKNEKLKKLLFLNYYIKNDKLNKFNTLELNDKIFEDKLLLKLKNYHSKLSNKTIENNNTLFENLYILKKISNEFDQHNFSKNNLNELNKINLNELNDIKDVYNHFLLFKNKEVK